jgi:ABC-2 type transport system permease protein
MTNWFTLHSLRRRCARIIAVARVETLRLLRDRTSLSLILVVPAVQILLFGYAVNLQPKNITLAIARHADIDSSWLDQSLADTGYFKVVGDHLTADVAQRMVTEQQALVALDLLDLAKPQLIADFSDPAAVRPAVLALQVALLQGATNSLLNGAEPQVAVQWLYNPEGKSAWALAPGLTGVGDDLHADAGRVDAGT